MAIFNSYVKLPEGKYERGMNHSSSKSHPIKSHKENPHHPAPGQW
jgi:hypothetical protein